MADVTRCFSEASARLVSIIVRVEAVIMSTTRSQDRDARAQETERTEEIRQSAKPANLSRSATSDFRTLQLLVVDLHTFHNDHLWNSTSIETGPCKASLLMHDVPLARDVNK